MNDLLTRQGIILVRDALISEYRFFTHVSPVRNFESIKRDGLSRRTPDGFNPSRLPPVVRASIPDDPDKVVCLWPRGSLNMNVQKHEPTFVLALASEALPPRLGLDWSHDSWSMACVRRQDAPQRPSIDIFLEVVQGSGSVVSYDPVPPISLLVRPKGSSVTSDPSHWQALPNTTKEQIEIVPALLVT
jgi:hypothetical protein